MTAPTPPTGPWRLICPADDPSSAHTFTGAAAWLAVNRVAQQLDLPHSWDPRSKKLYVDYPRDEEEIALNVPYYYQFDSRTDQGPRMCFSASCAMLLKFLKPGALSNSPNADDEYLGRVRTFGDTTDASAQVAALKHFGIEAHFSQQLGWAQLDEQLAKGRPIPIGILHKGPVTGPRGGGHWIIVIGRHRDGYLVHDPAGELDLVAGRYVRGDGRALLYSKANLGPRWLVEGGNSGWGIVAK